MKAGIHIEFYLPLKFWKFSLLEKQASEWEEKLEKAEERVKALHLELLYEQERNRNNVEQADDEKKHLLKCFEHEQKRVKELTQNLKDSEEACTVCSLPKRIKELEEGIEKHQSETMKHFGLTTTVYDETLWKLIEKKGGV